MRTSEGHAMSGRRTIKTRNKELGVDCGEVYAGEHWTRVKAVTFSSVIIHARVWHV